MRIKTYHFHVEDVLYDLKSNTVSATEHVIYTVHHSSLPPWIGNVNLQNIPRQEIIASHIRTFSMSVSK